MDHATGSATDRRCRVPLRTSSPNTVPVWDERVRGPWALEVAASYERRGDSVSTICASFRSAGSAWITSAWKDGRPSRSGQGVRLSDIARVVGVTPDAGYVDFQSFDDDYHESGTWRARCIRRR